MDKWSNIYIANKISDKVGRVILKTIAPTPTSASPYSQDFPRGGGGLIRGESEP